MARRRLWILVAALAVPTSAPSQGFFYVRDSFIAITNALLETHNPDVGIAGSWYRLLGQGLKIVNNALRPVANNTDELYGSNTSAGLSEYGIGVSVLFTAKQADPNCLTGFACTDHYGLLWGRGDVTSLNGYFARVTASGQVVILMNYQSNTTLLASTVIKAPPLNIAHPMVFAIRNSVKEIYWDGVMVLSTTDNTLTGSSPPLLKNGLGARSTVSGGTVLDDFFLSPFPTLTSVSPTSGPPGGGQIMQVTGTNVNGCYARVAGTVAQGISGSATNEVFYSPAHAAGVVTVDCATPYTFGVKIPLYAPSLPNSYTYTPTLQAARPHIFPVAGNNGDTNSQTFHSSFQIHNPGDVPMTGQVVLHPGGAPFTPSDPGLAFMVDPHATLFMPDLNAAIFSDGLGAAELTASSGPPPVAVMRLAPVNPNGAGGDIEEVFASVGLGEGDAGVLLAPHHPSPAGFDLTIRTFAGDASVRFDVRDAAGRLINSTTQSFPASSFSTLPGEQILGTASSGNESITAAVQSGFAMIHGLATDVSGDFDLQRAVRVADQTPERTILPVAVSWQGSKGNVRTSAQFYNPTSTTLTLQFSYLEFWPFFFSRPDAWCDLANCNLRRPAPYPSTDAGRLVLQPGEARFIPDLVQFLGRTGTGSVDIVADFGVPVMLFRTFWDGGPSGTMGAPIDTVPASAALNEGDGAVLLAPPTAGAIPMNLGVRTLDAAASLELTLRDSSGKLKRSVTRAYLAGALSQKSLAEVMGVVVDANDSLSIVVNSGAAIVYSVAIDGGSGDTTFHLARVQ